jgi:uncharacterized protein (DUF433 family)
VLRQEVLDALPGQIVAIGTKLPLFTASGNRDSLELRITAGATMAAVTDIGKLITSSPEIRGGRPRLAGTGVTVMRIAGWYKLGCSPEAIARKTGLSLAQIHAALAYYHTDQNRIDADLDSEAEEYDRLVREHSSSENPAEMVSVREDLSLLR